MTHPFVTICENFTSLCKQTAAAEQHKQAESLKHIIHIPDAERQTNTKQNRLILFPSYLQWTSDLFLD